MAVAESIARCGRNPSSIPPEDLAGWLEASAEALAGGSDAEPDRPDAELATLFRGAAAGLTTRFGARPAAAPARPPIR